MNSDVKARLEWRQLFEPTNKAGLVCRRCGISRPTLGKWVKRFQQRGAAGLEEKRRRPRMSPAQKIFDQPRHAPKKKGALKPEQLRHASEGDRI